jgi:hypothetical protein
MARNFGLLAWIAMASSLSVAPALADTTQEVVNKAPNGLALTPPMGWNSWNRFACKVDEATIRATADAIAAGKLRGFDERFHRLWRYYLMYCEGGFRGGAIDVAQVTMVKG